jgi:hypothetical protein
MREAERQLDGLALHLGAVADADDLQLALEAVLHSGDHVRDERAGQPVQGADVTIVALPSDVHDAVVDLRVEPAGDGLHELALRPLGPDGGAVHLHLHTLGNRDGFLADA